VKQSLIATCLGFLLPLTALTQFRVQGYVGTLVDDNSFNNYLQIKDRVTEASFEGAYEWSSEASNLQLFYIGSINYFSLLPSRTFQNHEGGLAYSYHVSEERGTVLNAGVSMSFRANREEYEIFDHSLLSLYANVRSELFDIAIIKGGYTIRSVSFSSLPEFAYTEHYAFIQGALSLPSRTTIILQGDIGFKHYSTPNTYSTSDLTRSPGGGQRSSDGPLPSVTQLIGMVRIGQGIASGTGLSVTGQYQVSPHKDVRYLTFTDGILSDDEFFDDHYGYEGPLAAMMLTQILPAEMRLRISGSLQRREYSSRLALDLEGNQIAAQRIDNRSVLSFSLEKSFSSLSVTATLAYDRIMNSSNDLYFAYCNNALSLRLSVSY
jgi:hypothetical protein